MFKKIATYIFVFVVAVSVPLTVLAQNAGNTAGNTVGNTVGNTGNAGVTGPSAVINPIAYDSLGALIVALVRFLLTMIGALSVLFIIIGAVRMVASAGNEKSVKAGKDTVTWAVIGLVVALLAFTIINLVQSVLGRK
jgi:uncharacterized membrane protein YgaE (UPF0421/DUF939 family)